MPITVTESYDSRSQTRGLYDGSGIGRIEIKYIVRGTYDETAARDAVVAQTPDTYSGLHRIQIQVEPVHIDNTNHDVCIYSASVEYGIRQQPETNESTFSFDTTGGTQHVTQSKSTIARYGTSAPDFKGAIGVTRDSVEGVDVTVPVYAFSETHYLASGAVTDAYKQTLMGLTGKVNSGSFRGFAAGEVLFLGASGQMRAGEDWEITFKFAASRNATGLTVGDITNIAKKGWEYMWVKYQEKVDTTANAMVQHPVAVYVEKVYDDGNFSGLGIG